MAGCDIKSVGPYVLEGTLGRGQTGNVNLSIILITFPFSGLMYLLVFYRAGEIGS